jgi:hypothetical protein
VSVRAQVIIIQLADLQVSLLLKDKKTVLKGEVKFFGTAASIPMTCSLTTTYRQVVNVDVETGMIFLACDAEKGSTVVMLHAILRLDVDARKSPPLLHFLLYKLISSTDPIPQARHRAGLQSAPAQRMSGS